MIDLVVDGNSLFARCWFAVKQIPSETMRLYMSSVLQFLDRRDGHFKLPISRTLFAWDGLSKTDKKRTPKPKIYIDTRYRVQEALLTLFNTVHGYHSQYEADDVVATVAMNSSSETVFVISGDKDLMQLQGGNVNYYCLNSKAVLPGRAICNKFHVKRPSQVALALAVMGDQNDKISGIPGWGPKKVEKLFEAVTEDMSFTDALAALQAQIPANLLPAFMDSLDKTLLHSDVRDVPEPQELRFCTSEELRETGIKGIGQAYETVAGQYEDQEANLASMLRDSSRAAHHRSPG